MNATPRDLADLLRMGRLPEAWIAPPATRELRELVRHRAKLVACCAPVCKCQVHAVLAKCRACRCRVSDLFGVAGHRTAGRAGAAGAVRGTGSTRCGG